MLQVLPQMLFSYIKEFLLCYIPDSFYLSVNILYKYHKYRRKTRTKKTKPNHLLGNFNSLYRYLEGIVVVN